ncbi:Papain-like cysteine peptidase superfamily [Forsythia ovata]|uniref:Papain-like cysteine peptidase superfamily n=1 Tax=Forsythia ovata TaxID=205694 RepID=A0ABD1V1R5_9LAMI
MEHEQLWRLFKTVGMILWRKEQETNDKVGNEINASVAISLLDDEIVFSEEDFRHMDEPAEKNRCRAQKRPAKVKRMNGKFGADSNSVDKLSPLIVYTSGHNNRFNYNWEEVDHVFIPVFMDKKAHWILVDLDMSNLHLDVYNSSFKTIRDVAVLDVVEPLRQMILHIICHSKVLTRDIPVCQSHCARIFHIKQMGE